MARIKSAGIMLFRGRDDQLEVLLGHLGSPYWRGKTIGAWTIPKGHVETGETSFQAAGREFTEEIGHEPPTGERLDLGIVHQSRKDVHIWALEGDFDPLMLSSATVETTWPPGSDTPASFPELDEAAWFTIARAHEVIIATQRPFLKRLERQLRRRERTAL